MGQELRIALAQLAIIDGDKARNLRKIEEAVEQAWHESANLLILPELALTGSASEQEMKLLAEPQGGVSQQAIQAMQKRFPVAIVYSFPESTANDELYITTCFLDKTGEPLAYYRKTHLFTEEKSVFSPGEEFVHFEVAGIHVGLLTCYDIEFPEPARSLALAGVQLLIVNSANMSPYEQLHRTFITARALENQFFVVYCNRVGSNERYTYSGQSAVIDPMGEVLMACEDGVEVTKVVQISLQSISQAKRDFDYLRDRREVDIFSS
jgi:predicted amidohydrolase